MSHSSLLELGDYICNQALEKQAQSVEVYLSRSIHYYISMERNFIKLADASVDDGLGIRLFKNQSLGFSSTNIPDESHAMNCLQKALDTASVTPYDEYNVLPHAIPITPVEGLYDPRLEQIKLQDVCEYAQRLLDAAKSYDPRVHIDSGDFSLVIDEDAIVTSNGIRYSEKSGYFLYFLLGLAASKLEISASSYVFESARNTEQLHVEERGRELSEHLIQTLGARKIEQSFNGRVIFSPDTIASILLPVLSHNLDAENIQRNSSYFIDKIGQSIAHKSVTVIDDATIPAKLGSSSIDREGVPHKPLNLIHEGVLENYFYRTQTAARDQIQSTAHAVGSHQQIPGSGLTNILLAPGQVSYKDFIQSMKKGLLVNRFSGNTNPVTGDFSGVVKGGFYIEKGRIQFPVIETMIAGNVFEVLRSIEGISLETESLLEADAPYLLVSGISITRG